MIDSGASVTQVDASLRRVARVNGLADVAIVVLPTALFVSVAGDEDVQTAVESAVAVRASIRSTPCSRSSMPPSRARSTPRWASSGWRPRVPARRRSGRRFTSSASLYSRPGWRSSSRAGPLDLLVASMLGVALGALQLYRSRLLEAYVLFLSVVSAFVVTLAVFLLARAGLDFNPYTTIIAALVTGGSF